MFKPLFWGSLCESNGNSEMNLKALHPDSNSYAQNKGLNESGETKTASTDCELPAHAHLGRYCYFL